MLNKGDNIMKTNIGVFFGGSSVEHEVAVISAVQAMNYINREKYDVTPVYITKNGEMYTGDKLFSMESFRNIPALLKECEKVAFCAQDGKFLLKRLDTPFFGRKKDTEINLAFPIVHGTNCEDGSLQGYFETIRIPYIGCDVCSSAVGMDKAFFKSVMKDAGLPVLPCITVRARAWFEDSAAQTEKIEKEIGYPLIVKPANTGSSVGISKVNDPSELSAAVELACSFAEKILIERAVEKLREINCSVLGNADDCDTSVCEEPFMNDAILSYEDKYMSNQKGGSKGMSSLSRQCPAKISEEKSNEIRELSKKVFSVLGCSGVSRIDYLMDTADNDKVYINEINTIPGSLAFYLWEATGVKYTDMIDRLAEIAFKRERDKNNTMFTIKSNLLDSASPFGQKGAKGTKGF